MISILLLFINLWYLPPSVGTERIKVAITLDDFPLLQGKIFTPTARTEQFIAAGREAGATLAFFCVGERGERPAHTQSLVMANTAGHFLANHSMTHPFTSAISTEQFRAELCGVDSLLESYIMKRRWFRFPYLDYGLMAGKGGSLEKAERARTVLEEHGYTDGYVSLFTSDYLVESLIQGALARGQSVDYERLRSVYLALIKSWCEHYVTEWQHQPFAPPVHTLLLHANDLNALYLKDIIMLLREMGWEIVSPEEAFQSAPILPFSQFPRLKKAACFTREEITARLIAEKVYESS